MRYHNTFGDQDLIHAIIYCHAVAFKVWMRPAAPVIRNNQEAFYQEGGKMRTSIYAFCRAASVCGFLLVIYACAVTTDSIESSSKTFQNTTDASSDFTSSTSPSDSKSSENEQALAFSKAKMERIKTDIAMGGGEHLTSLAILMRVPDRNQPEFFALTKNNFSTLFSSEQTTAEELLARLEDELRANPELLK